MPSEAEMGTRLVSRMERAEQKLDLALRALREITGDCVTLTDARVVAEEALLRIENGPRS